MTGRRKSVAPASTLTTNRQSPDPSAMAGDLCSGACLSTPGHFDPRMRTTSLSSAILNFATLPISCFAAFAVFQSSTACASCTTDTRLWTAAETGSLIHSVPRPKIVQIALCSTLSWCRYGQAVW